MLLAGKRKLGQRKTCSVRQRCGKIVQVQEGCPYTLQVALRRCIFEWLPVRDGVEKERAPFSLQHYSPLPRRQKRFPPPPRHIHPTPPSLLHNYPVSTRGKISRGLPTGVAAILSDTILIWTRLAETRSGRRWRRNGRR